MVLLPAPNLKLSIKHLAAPHTLHHCSRLEQQQSANCIRHQQQAPSQRAGSERDFKCRFYSSYITYVS